MIGAPHLLGWVLLGGAVGLLAACASYGAGVEGHVFEAMSEAPRGPASVRRRLRGRALDGHPAAIRTRKLDVSARGHR
jgi:hypothetical protein